jgi:hypothetical protein
MGAHRKDKTSKKDNINYRKNKMNSIQESH